jgi:hypothetical protein
LIREVKRAGSGFEVKYGRRVSTPPVQQAVRRFRLQHLAADRHDIASAGPVGGGR